MVRQPHKKWAAAAPNTLRVPRLDDKAKMGQKGNERVALFYGLTVTDGSGHDRRIVDSSRNPPPTIQDV